MRSVTHESRGPLCQDDGVYETPANDSGGKYEPISQTYQLESVTLLDGTNETSLLTEDAGTFRVTNKRQRILTYDLKKDQLGKTYTKVGKVRCFR